MCPQLFGVWISLNPQHWIEPHKILYIPHGIDTDSPHGIDTDSREHMRDWFVIHRTIDQINYRRLDVEST